MALVLDLRMNEGTGNIVYDKSGNNIHGTIYNGEWINHSLHFNNTNSYVECENVDLLQITGPVTAFARFKRDSALSADVVLYKYAQYTLWYNGTTIHWTDGRGNGVTAEYDTGTIEHVIGASFRGELGDEVTTENCVIFIGGAKIPTMIKGILWNPTLLGGYFRVGMSVEAVAFGGFLGNILVYNDGFTDDMMEKITCPDPTACFIHSADSCG